MTTLTDRLAQADKPTRELLLEVWGGCPVCSGDCGSANPPVMFCPTSRYLAMLDAEAWTSAVEMLLPADHPRWAVTGRNSATCGNKDGAPGPLDWTFASTPALALAIACLKARGL